MQEWLFLIKPNICLFFRNLHLGNKSFISDHFDIAVDTCTSTVFIDEKKTVLDKECQNFILKIFFFKQQLPM